MLLISSALAFEISKIMSVSLSSSTGLTVAAVLSSEPKSHQNQSHFCPATTTSDGNKILVFFMICLAVSIKSGSYNDAPTFTPVAAKKYWRYHRQRRYCHIFEQGLSVHQAWLRLWSRQQLQALVRQDYQALETERLTPRLINYPNKPACLAQ